jgi:hypothetical protein
VAQRGKLRDARVASISFAASSITVAPIRGHPPCSPEWTFPSACPVQQARSARAMTLSGCSGPKIWAFSSALGGRGGRQRRRAR